MRVRPSRAARARAVSTNVANSAAAAGLNRGRMPTPRGLPMPRMDRGRGGPGGLMNESAGERLTVAPSLRPVRSVVGTSFPPECVERRQWARMCRDPVPPGLRARRAGLTTIWSRPRISPAIVRQMSYIKPKVPEEAWGSGADPPQRHATDKWPTHPPVSTGEVRGPWSYPHARPLPEVRLSWGGLSRNCVVTQGRQGAR
jgi:hypothetical protein